MSAQHLDSSDASATKAPDIRDLERFLYAEARLLDEQQWPEWEALFTDDGEYWVPATPGQPDGINHQSIMYETKLLRAVRLKRYSHPNAISLQPLPRSVHVLSNVMLDEFDGADGSCVVNSRFIMFQYRRDEQHTFGGSCTHRLVMTPAGYRIASKRVDLVNCDAAMENILICL
jgi:3-phenylpropionate/cinnamic acid dioxygenase small subunit